MVIDYLPAVPTGSWNVSKMRMSNYLLPKNSLNDKLYSEQRKSFNIVMATLQILTVKCSVMLRQ